jgi:predicted transcriptional regulator
LKIILDLAALQCGISRRKLPPWRALCYALNMADDEDRKPVLKPAEADRYHATPEEIAGIDRGLKAAREGRFATDDQIERLFKKHRPA